MESSGSATCWHNNGVGDAVGLTSALGQKLTSDRQ
jgi:hypothetical protein